MYAMDGLLNLVNTEKAEELHLDFGVPPAIQVQGELHTIEGPPVSPRNIELLLQNIASELQIRDIKGRNCVVGPHVYLTGITKVGSHNKFHAGCVIGDAPQDLKYEDEPTRLRIGDHNIFREHVTVHRSNKTTEDTVIGSHNYLMANCHVGHNSHLGNHIIIANGALLGGHVTVQDRAFLSGNCVVHQFCRVGTLAIMQGNSGVSQDLPPFTMVQHINEMCGLNVVGLRRAGFTAEQRLELKRLYHVLFRSGKNLRAAIKEAQKDFNNSTAKIMLDFVAEAKRGVCTDASRAISENEDE
jgi:UDP-N-acetylglucosamine acyltransferase